MNKTISINLGGRNFFIEEDAFKKLDAYLSAIKSHFAAYHGSAEIVADMEARIAEKFLEKSQNNPQAVITAQDVDSLIADLGSVEDIAGEAGAGQKSSQKDSSAFGKKRLMRDGDNKIIAGVASGLAAYFDFDPFWVRLVFGILLFAGGSIIPIYFLLWLIMPEAKTVTEKMQMRGEPLNLDSISETIKERASEFKQHLDGMGSKKNASEQPIPTGPAAKKVVTSFFREVFEGLGRIISFIFKAITKIISLGLIIGSAFTIAMITLAIVFSLFNMHSPYVSFPFAVIAHGAPYYVLLISAYVLVVIPLAFLMLLAISLFNRRKVLNQGANFILFGTWLLALVVAGAVGGRYIPDYVQQVKNSPELQVVSKDFVDIRDFKKVDLSNSIDYKLVEGKEYKIRASGWAMDLDRLDVSKEGDVLKVTRKNRDFCFFCFGGHTQVEITAPSFESITAHNSSDLDIPSLTATSTTINLSNSSSAGIVFKGKNLNVNLLNSSFLKAAGSTDILKAQLLNSSRLDASELRATTTEISTGNSSRANVWVTGNLKYNSYNSSRIYYLGNPKLEGNSKSVPVKDGEGLDYQSDEDFYPVDPVEPATPQEQ